MYCRNNVGVIRESFNHCFLLCATVQGWLHNLLNLISLDNDLNNENFRQLYWFGIQHVETLTVAKQKIFLLIFDLFRYLVFKNKVKKRIPSNNTFASEYLFALRWFLYSNKKLKRATTGIPELANLLRALG
jgi:hypothetical protein